LLLKKDVDTISAVGESDFYEMKIIAEIKFKVIVCSTHWLA